MKSYTLDLEGLSVTQIQIDFRFTLVFEGEGSISFSCPFDYINPQTSPLSIDPEGAKARLLPAIELFGEIVRRAYVLEGVVSIEFENGVRLTSRADEDYEAWSFDDLQPAPNNRKMVCLPGGGVAVWGEFAPYRSGI